MQDWQERNMDRARALEKLQEKERNCNEDCGHCKEIDDFLAADNKLHVR